jgi:epoxyqueuosine reductase
VSTAVELAEQLQQAAVEAGFDLWGVASCRLEDLSDLQRFPAWIAAGRGGEMAYLEALDEHGSLKRGDVAAVAPWARSAVVCALNYNTKYAYSTENVDPSRGWISRYAWGGAAKPADYHNVMMEKLRPVEARLRQFAPAIQTRCYVDTGPIVERVLAKYAGVGWVGKNTCIIHQGLGSWLFLGVILTSLELAPGIPAPDRCGSCTRCLDACPTQAFMAPHQLDATRCISYLTIEKRGGISEELRPGMGRHVFGCDICQDVCPWNRRAPATAAAEFQPQPQLLSPSLEWLATLSEEEFRRVFRGSPVRRAKRSGLRRNAVIAMGNSGDQRFVPLLETLAHDPDYNVAEHAAWALRRLQRGMHSGPVS